MMPTQAEVAADLSRNGFEALCVETAKAARRKVSVIIPPGAAVGVGGTVTIRELNLLEDLRRRGHPVYDYRQDGLTPQEIRAVELKQITAPFFLTSTNAVTRDGRPVNIDNTGNRVAAMIFGPEHVIVVAGRNKIVATVDDALARIQPAVAPQNAFRRKDKAGSDADLAAPPFSSSRSVPTGMLRDDGLSIAPADSAGGRLVAEIAVRSGAKAAGR